jgi:drug/metabolite transporter (DMT)-like permease
MRPADLARLLLLSALWGGSFVFIRVAAPALGPIVLVEGRVLTAGLALLVYAVATKQRRALRERWRQYLVIGALNSAIPFVLISTAELHLTASLASILNATSPLFGALIAAAWIKEPLTPKKIVGIALGVTGVTVLAGWSPLTLSGVVILSIGASLSGALFYGLAGVYTKARAAGAPALGMAVGSQLFASVLLLPLVPMALPSAAPSARVIACVLALALFCTALAYVLYFRLIVDVGPTRAITVTFLIPISGVVWAMLFLGEDIKPGTLLGCGIILVGTALVTGVRLGRVRVAPRLRVEGDGIWEDV